MTQPVLRFSDPTQSGPERERGFLLQVGLGGNSFVTVPRKRSQTHKPPAHGLDKTSEGSEYDSLTARDSSDSVANEESSDCIEDLSHIICRPSSDELRVNSQDNPVSQDSVMAYIYTQRLNRSSKA